jgi:tetratricopeptide (TPR) repeat protein
LDYPWADLSVGESLRVVWDATPAGPPTIDFWSIQLAWLYGRFVDAAAAVARLRQLAARLAKSGHRWLEAFARQSLGRVLIWWSWHVPGYESDAEAQAWFQPALSAFESLGDEREAAITLMFMGFDRQRVSDPIEAKRILLEAQERLHAIGEVNIAATINWRLAEITMTLGDLSASFDYFHKMTDSLLHSGKIRQAISVISRESYEAVRYGSLEYALRLRERSLALSEQSGDRYLEAWDHWEMGELFRVMGRGEEARRWYEQSRVIFDEIGNNNGQSFYYRGLGELALAGGDADEAEARFRESYEWSTRTFHNWQEAYSLFGLGRAATVADKMAEARTHYVNAIHTITPLGDPGLILRGIAAIAQFYRRRGNAARAAELARLVLSHSLSWREARLEMGELLGLSPEESLARREARPFDLSEVVEGLAGELSLNPTAPSSGYT